MILIKNKKLYVFIVMLFCVMAMIVYGIVFKPIKYGIDEEDIDTNKNYIICIFTEKNGFYWQMIDNNLGINNRNVKLKKINLENYLSSNLLQGENKYIFYGSLVEDDSEYLDGYDDNYVTFNVDEWEIFKVIKRKGKLFIGNPPRYLYIKDFVLT